MAHYALLNSENVVVQVIVGKDENEGGVDWEDFYSKETGLVCKRTSYNTYANYHATGGKPFRANYAGIGFIYNSELDAFLPPKPYPSWLLDKDVLIWYAPVPKPSDIAQNKIYDWDEQNLRWVERV